MADAATEKVAREGPVGFGGWFAVVLARLVLGSLVCLGQIMTTQDFDERLGSAMILVFYGGMLIMAASRASLLPIVYAAGHVVLFALTMIGTPSGPDQAGVVGVFLWEIPVSIYLFTSKRVKNTLNS